MSPRVVAMVVDPWDYPFNGTVVSARRFVEALRAQGHDIRLMAIGAGFDRLSIPGVNGLINAMRAPLAKPDRAAIRAALRGVDVLHVQFPFFLGRAAIQEARAIGLPVIASFHVQPENVLANVGLGGAALSSALYALFISEFYNKADLVIAPSPFAADLLRRHGTRAPIEVVSNGVPERFFTVPAREAAPTRFQVLSVGRLAREKRQDTLLRAVAASQHRARIDLTLAGAGPREEALKALAAELGLDARIGTVSDAELLEHYARADLFVHCGAVELEGMSVLEAMAAGAPVLVSDSRESACAYLVTDARAKFHAGDPEDLRAKLDDWLSDGAARAAQGAANRQLAASLSHESSVAKLAALYERVSPTSSGSRTR